jgi:hypothetical protein
MQIYLPIAELSINVLVILGMGGAVGFLSGMFGVGGGFLMTPLLIFAGIRQQSRWRPAPTRSWAPRCRGRSPIGGGGPSTSRWASSC